MAPPSSLTNPIFTPIQEGNESEETLEDRNRVGSTKMTTTTKPRLPREPTSGGHRGVSCMDCRPSHREKTSVVVVPVDTKNSLYSPSPTPNGLFKSLIAGISRRSPKPPPTPGSSKAAPPDTVAELSHKLILATKKRDEAILESFRLKHSMNELEKKLTRLEAYCDSLKSGFEICCYSHMHIDEVNRDTIIKNFLSSISEARYSIRFFSKSLTSHLKLMGIKVLERLSAVLKGYDIKLTSSSNPRTLQLYFEALLNSVFYQDFETAGFGKGSMKLILNPAERSEANFVEFNVLKGLGWDEVLSKGTKHFSEEFSKFCDRKMSEIVGILGWNRAWPEQLLQAFFGASKSVWLVHLLANSVHPGFPIFRVEKTVRFDPIYMEDVGGEKAKKLVPTLVRIMVAPGFYVYDDVVKCKVLCRYYNSNYSSVFSSSNGEDNRNSLSPP